MSLTIEMDLNAWSEGGHRQMVFCSWPFLGRFQNVLSKSQPDRRLEFPQMVRSSPMSAHKGYRSIKAFFFSVIVNIDLSWVNLLRGSALRPNQSLKKKRKKP